MKVTRIMPLISVITVTFNAKDLIEETMLSVLNQTLSDIEYIVIDGGSTDGTLDIIQKYADKLSYLVSEPDKGIFDAMNKGIIQAKGKWINFMNAGDTFVDFEILNKIFGQNNNFKNIDVIWGETHFDTVDGCYTFKSKPFYENTKYCSPMGICHQSLFIRIHLAKSLMFDTSFQIAADFNMIKLLFDRGCKFISLGYVVAKVDTQGFSAMNKKLQREEEARINKIDKTLMFRIWTLYVVFNTKFHLIAIKIIKSINPSIYYRYKRSKVQKVN